jgi:hypothetical protein
MSPPPDIDPHLLAIEVNALRVAQIRTLERDCAFWREQCHLLGRLVEQLRAQVAKLSPEPAPPQSSTATPL